MNDSGLGSWSKISNWTHVGPFEDALVAYQTNLDSQTGLSGADLLFGRISEHAKPRGDCKENGYTLFKIVPVEDWHTETPSVLTESLLRNSSLYMRYATTCEAETIKEAVTNLQVVFEKLWDRVDRIATRGFLDRHIIRMNEHAISHIYHAISHIYTVGKPLQCTVPCITSLSTGSCNPEKWHADGCYGSESDHRIQQKKYDEWFSSKVHLVCHVLHQLKNYPKDLSIVALLKQIANARKQYAIDSKTKNAERFGSWRVRGGVHTVISLDSRYAAYNAKIGTLLAGNECLTIETFIPGVEEKIILSEIGALKLDTGESRYYIEHAPSIYSDSRKQVIFSHINRWLVHNIVENHLPEEDFVRNLARIHWWLAQLCLFHRGSASIAEILIQGIAAFRGYSSQWKSGTLPNLEAIPRNLEAFRELYLDLLILTVT